MQNWFLKDTRVGRKCIFSFWSGAGLGISHALSTCTSASVYVVYESWRLNGPLWDGSKAGSKGTRSHTSDNTSTIHTSLMYQEAWTNCNTTGLQVPASNDHFSRLLSSWKPWTNALHQVVLLRSRNGNESLPPFSFSGTFSHNVPTPLETQGKANRSSIFAEPPGWSMTSPVLIKDLTKAFDRARLSDPSNKALLDACPGKACMLQIKHSVKLAWSLGQEETESPSKCSLLLLLALGPKEVRPAGASTTWSPAPYLEKQESTSSSSSRSFPSNAFS